MRAYLAALTCALAASACTAGTSSTPASQDIETRMIISETVRAVAQSQLSPPGAARVYAYTLTAAHQSRSSGGSAALAAYDTLAHLMPGNPTLGWGPLEGAAERARAAGGRPAQEAEATSLRISREADEDGLLEHAREHLRAEEKPEAVDLNALKAEIRARIGIPEEGLNRVEDSIEQLRRYGALDRTLAEDVLFAWVPTSLGYVREAPRWGELRPLAASTEAMQACRLEEPDRARILQEGIHLMQTHSLERSSGYEVTIWLGGSGTETPAGMWILMAAQAAEDAGKDPLEVAAAVAAAAHNATILGWSEKYRHNLIRPETLWELLHTQKEPLLRDTPGHPAYPSGHSQVAAAGHTVISEMIGEDTPVTLATPEVLGWPAQEVRFSSSREALESASRSRIDAGFHYPADTEAGEKLGECVARTTLAALR